MIDPRSARLEWSQVADLVKEGVKRSVGDPVDMSWTDAWRKNGRESEITLPFRTGMDRAIRRSRFKDLWLFLAREPEFYDLVLDHWFALRGSWDYISILCTTWAVIIHGRSWLLRLRALGAFSDGIQQFILITKRLNNIVKTRQFLDDDRFDYFECYNLVGYLNPPVLGFNVLTEAEKLANGGLFKCYPNGLDFKTFARETLTMQVPSVSWRTLEEHVRSDDWLTSGSSDLGRIEYVNEESVKKKTKAKKNTIKDAVPIEKLIRLAYTSDVQINKTIIKSETGKIRLAVASDWATYIQMDWILRMLGGAYKQWPGSTIEEGGVDEYRRMLDMLGELAKHYGIPFDYDAFDHQITTQDLVDLWDIFVEAARANVPDHGMAEFDACNERIRTGFFRSKLISVSDKVKVIMNVTGGLMSGLRITSVIGNAWNTVQTAAVIANLSDLGFGVEDIHSYIRGDDSAIYTRNQVQAQSSVAMFDLMGVKAGKGKFSIRYEEIEFLRIWYANNKMVGYVNRTIPSLVERKPWNSEPWDVNATIRHIYSAVCTLRRRSGKPIIEVIWKAMRQNWSALNKVPVAALGVPEQLGGLGIEPWDGKFMIKPAMPKFHKPQIEILSQTNWRRDRLKEEAVSLGLMVDDEIAGSLAREELIAAMTTDNTPGFLKGARQRWKESLKSAAPKTVPFSESRDQAMYYSLEMPRPSDVTRQALDDMVLGSREKASDYGAMEGTVNVILSAKKFLRPLGMKLSAFVREYYPIVYERIQHLGMHIGDGLDWLGGKLSVATSKISPGLSRMVENYTVKMLGISGVRRTKISNWYKYAPVVESMLLTVPVISALSGY